MTTPLHGVDHRFKSGWAHSLFRPDNHLRVPEAEISRLIEFRFRFPGFEHVWAAGAAGSSPGLYYIGARWMDPELGRWLSLDFELGRLGAPQTMNRYVYCVNNPLNVVDPGGLRGIMLKGHGKWSSTGTPGTFDEFMTLWGFVPILDTVSDIYFVGAALCEGNYEEAAIFAGFAAIPFVGASYYKAGKAGWNFLKHADDVPTGPVVRNADEAMDALRRANGGRISLTAAEDIPAYRIYGGKSLIGGRSWTIIDPRYYSEVSYRLKSGIPDTNSGGLLAEGFIKKGTAFELFRSEQLWSSKFGRYVGAGMPEIDRSVVVLTRCDMPMFWAGVL